MCGWLSVWVEGSRPSRGGNIGNSGNLRGEGGRGGDSAATRGIVLITRAMAEQIKGGEVAAPDHAHT